MYVASFSFNGKSEATADEVTDGGFNILIDNSEGGWKIFYGLSWEHSEPCLGDI